MTELLEAVELWVQARQERQPASSRFDPLVLDSGLLLMDRDDR